MRHLKIPNHYALVGARIVRRFRGYQIEGTLDEESHAWDLTVTGPEFRGVMFGLPKNLIDELGRDMVNTHISVSKRAQQVLAQPQPLPLAASES